MPDWFTEKRVNRFWSKVDKSGECWIWMGSFNENGYGQYGMGQVEYGKMFNKNFLASRYSFEATYGFINKLFCCHHCDNPKCVRPDHLFLGTQSDNMQDAKSKGRLKKEPATHCKRGHEFSGDNLILVKRNNARLCRTCLFDGRKKRIKLLRLTEEGRLKIKERQKKGTEYIKNKMLTDPEYRIKRESRNHKKRI